MRSAGTAAAGAPVARRPRTNVSACSSGATASRPSASARPPRVGGEVDGGDRRALRPRGHGDARDGGDGKEDPEAHADTYTLADRRLARDGVLARSRSSVPPPAGVR